MSPSNGLLLDTHVWIWLSAGSSNVLKPDLRQQLDLSSLLLPLHVSIISVWEVAMLAGKGRLSFSMPMEDWVAQALSHPAIRRVAFDDPAVAIDSNTLPGNFHSDPTDWLLVATARVGGYTLVTHDRRILDYARSGYVQVLAA